MALTRRKLLINSLLAGAGSIVLPSMLQSCSKEDELSKIDYSGTVIVIGAGAAGLSAAWYLHKRGISVSILEATGKMGGRIRSLTGWADFAMELGAEEVHGNKTEWYKIVNGRAKFNTVDNEDYVWYNNTLLNESQAAQVNAYNKAVAVLEGIFDYRGADIPVSQYLTDNGIDPSISFFLEARLGNEYGSTNALLGVYSLAKGDDNWSAGDNDYSLKDNNMQAIIEDYYQELMPKVRFNQPVTSLEWTNEGVVITTDGNDPASNTFIADKVIVTASLGVLQSGALVFNPPLPNAHQDAVGRLKMGQGMKIILQFSQRFWPDDTGSLYLPGLVPEFWAPGLGRGSNLYLIAFVMGDVAQQLSDAGAGAVSMVLAQLEQAFGANTATAFLIDYRIADWIKEPYVLGSYSYPGINTYGAAEILATPIEGVLFFAGEATHKGHFGTVHGAIETGKRAHEQVVAQILKEQ
jgi:monoamine oxidase